MVKVLFLDIHGYQRCVYIPPSCSLIVTCNLFSMPMKLLFFLGHRIQRWESSAQQGVWISCNCTKWWRRICTIWNIKTNQSQTTQRFNNKKLLYLFSFLLENYKNSSFILIFNLSFFVINRSTQVRPRKCSWRQGFNCTRWTTIEYGNPNHWVSNSNCRMGKGWKTTCSFK